MPARRSLEEHRKVPGRRGPLARMRQGHWDPRPPRDERERPRGPRTSRGCTRQDPAGCHRPTAAVHHSHPCRPAIRCALATPAHQVKLLRLARPPPARDSRPARPIPVRGSRPARPIPARRFRPVRPTSARGSRRVRPIPVRGSRPVRPTPARDSSLARLPPARPPLRVTLERPAGPPRHPARSPDPARPTLLARPPRAAGPLRRANHSGLAAPSPRVTPVRLVRQVRPVRDLDTGTNDRRRGQEAADGRPAVLATRRQVAPATRRQVARATRR